MNYHNTRILLPLAAMAYLTSTEAGRCGHLLYTFVKLVGIGQSDER